VALRGYRLGGVEAYFQTTGSERYSKVPVQVTSRIEPPPLRAESIARI
jgi:hypothetical protein